jgi:hypothetical protein
MLVGELAGQPLAAEVAAIETGMVLVAGETGEVAEAVTFESELLCHLVTNQVLNSIDSIGLGVL